MQLERCTDSAIGIKIREFAPGDEVAFRELNEAWISRDFVLEPKDKTTLSDPRKYILEPGGRIFVAVRDGEVVACCALAAMAPGEFEVAKMAVAEAWRGAGIGRQLLGEVICEARRSGATRLYLETSEKLVAARHLYESLGFRHLSPAQIIPSPYARANVYMEMLLQHKP